MGPPIFTAAVIVQRVAPESFAPSCSATTRMLIVSLFGWSRSDDLRLCTQFVDELAHVLDHHPTLALARFFDLEQFEAWRWIDAERGRSDRLERLFLGLHDV